jgi:hypothetical protein
LLLPSIIPSVPNALELDIFFAQMLQKSVTNFHKFAMKVKDQACIGAITCMEQLQNLLIIIVGGHIT